MNPLYEKFPEHVLISGEKYRIVTDFREYIKLLDLLRDNEVDTMEKAELILMWFIDPPQADFHDCLKALSSFMTDYRGKEEHIDPEDDTKENRGKEKQVLSYTQDAPFILSGFIECYGIDLTTVKYKHWWKFRMLIDGMNEECELKKRMSYRSIDSGKIKDKAERERIRKIQRQIAITENIATDEDIGDAFGNMMW